MELLAKAAVANASEKRQQPSDRFCPSSSLLLVSPTLLAAKLLQGNSPSRFEMVTITMAQLIAYAKTFFAEEFAKLPPVTAFTVKDGDLLLVGKNLEWDADESNDVYFLCQPYGGHLVSFDDDHYGGIIAHIPHHNVVLDEPFCWIMGKHITSTCIQKLDAFVRYYLELGGYGGDFDEITYDFVVLFRLACEDVARGLTEKSRNENGGNATVPMTTTSDVTCELPGRTYCLLLN